MGAHEMRVREALAAAVALLLVVGVLGLLAPRAARADSAPPVPSPANPVTVSADALPTVQINGVVWAQVAVGNTVYVAGSFSRARPAGAPAGSQETVRNNLLAYDITTGNLITSFVLDLNGQALAITASPDGSRIYVGGDFTSVNGQSRNRIAAFTPAGVLVDSFRPSVNGQVRAIAATNDTVYLGGSLSAVGGVGRNRLAAVRASDGGLLPWAPQPGVGPTSGNRDGNTNTSNAVMALVVAGGNVVAAGRFDSLNGTKATGIGALDPVSGATRPFAVNQLITNQGVNSAIYSLSTDGTAVYGTGYDYYGPGNVEGNFAARATDGQLIQINDCRGDSYSSYPMNGALYVASHTHNCDSIGGQIEQNPRVEKRGTAYTLTPTTVVRWGTNVNWVGRPAGTQLAWNPEIASGSYTGQYQGSWSVTGNGRYVSYGGEFPRVNGSTQQGLVRFAMPDIAPNRVGPQSGGFAASVASPAPGVARISWPETWDYDNEFLTYRVYRDTDTGAPVGEVTRGSRWWDLDQAGFSDLGVTGQHRWRVRAVDAFGNSVQTAWVTATIPAGSASPRPYVAAVVADGATDHWPLSEGSGGTGYADVGGNDLSIGSGVTRGSGGAVQGDPDPATTFNGSSSSLAATQDVQQAPGVFSVEAWFRTTSSSGGKIIGFGNRNTGTSTTYDRHVYMDGAGRVLFGVTETNQRRVIQSGTGFNDGGYHHVVATLSTEGMALYVDGVLRATRSSTTVGPNYYGYWRVGGDATWSGNQWFNGRIDEVAVYPTALSAVQIANHHALGTGGAPVNVPPTASFTQSVSNLSVTVDGTGSTDTDGSVAGYRWEFGDGATATTPTATHAYAAGGTYTVTLTVTDDDGATGSSSQQVTVSGPPVNAPPTAAFTAGATGLSVQFDGSGSGDADGSLTAWSWDFGDGATSAVGPSVTHGYATPGTYTVTLVVTDDDGATDDAVQTITVTDGTAPAVLARDTFGRTVSNGLGTADVGGPWTAWQGGDRQSVAPGVATFALPGAGNNTVSYLGGVSQTSADVLTTFSVSTTPTGAGTYVYVGGRFVGTLQAYRVRVRLLADGRVGLALSRYAGGGEQFPGGELIVPGLTVGPGTPVNARMVITGTNPTSIAATVWRGGTPEPAPQMTWTDTTAELQVPGGFSLMAHRPGGTTAATEVRFTGFTATVPGTGGGQPPANVPPTAAFTATPTDLQVAVDGTGSADSDGSIASYAWNWGDGSPVETGTSATAGHTYATAGEYTISLTVTDDDGATHSTTQAVSVSAPSVNQPPTAAFVATPTGLSVALDGSTSGDPDGTVAGYAWDFGDGATSTAGPGTTHAYGSAGTYTVTLTVTDDDGATGSTAQPVTVAAGTAEVLAQDAFGRTVTNGLGTADVGGAWTAWQGGNRQSVTPGTATFALPAAGNNTVSYLGGVSQTSAEVVTTFSVSSVPTGAGTYVYIGGRFVGTLQAYRVRVRLLADGRVALALSRYSGGGEQFPGGELVVPGVTFAPGTPLTVRVLVTGTSPTSIAATVWRSAATEPAAPQMTWTDNTPELQVPGGFSLMAHRPGGTTAATEVRFTSFLATVPQP